MKYVYPAVFTPEENGLFTVNFPDLESCYTCGNDLGDALYMAEDVLTMTLVSYENNSTPIPTPSKKLSLEDSEFQSFIVCDIDSYRKQNIFIH